MNTRITPVVEKAPYVAASYTGIASFTLNDWAILIGVVVTVLTGIVNWYYKRRSYQVWRRRMERGDPPRKDDLDGFDKL